MALSRKDLEKDGLRKHFADAYPASQVLNHAQLDQSIDLVLSSHPANQDVWLFGYGSLIWNPCIDYSERRTVLLHGHHRSFCVWSHMGRGTKDRPGLVLGLDAGGSCHGVAYRIEGHKVRNELRLVWRREMTVGTYSPRWVRAKTPDGYLRAIAFAAKRDHPSYAGKLSVDDTARILATARGHLGTPAEYLHSTLKGLQEHGIHDGYLTRLARSLRDSTRRR